MRFSHLVVSAFLTVSVTARAADVMTDAATIAESGNKIRRGIEDQETPDWVKGSSKSRVSDDVVEEILVRSQRVIDQALSVDSDASAAIPSKRHIEVFVSVSLGEAALREIMEEASGRVDVTVVFRGVPESVSFAAGIRRIQSLVSGIEPAPTVVIDPTRFTALNVSDVPAIALLSDDRLIATASGITGIDAFLAQVNSGKRGNLGRLGPVRAIAEPDLIAVMQQRIVSLDLAQKSAGAMKRYFDKAEFVSLPSAEKPQARTVDPTVVVTQDIVDANGRVLVKAGRRINPLDGYPFSARLIVFDATSRSEREIARRVMHEGKFKAILLATRLDRESGWDGLKRVEDEMRAPVYLLTPEVRDRFGITHTVSIVEAKGKVFEIREVPAAEQGR